MEKLINQAVEMRRNYINHGFEVNDNDTRAECYKMSEHEIKAWIAQMKRELAAQ